MNEFGNPFSICFNMLKLRYSIYDESITSLGFLKPTDKVNVFINLEAAWKYLSMVKDLEKKLILNQDFKIIMIADIINIAAHYKEFFKNNGLDTKVFLYMTDFESEIESFKESKYNEDYRSYYLNKYNSNPKFILLTDALKHKILPKVRTICDFIPDVYFISSKNIDGSLIPFIIGKSMPNRENFIISSDKYETQYLFEDHFTEHLILRNYGSLSISCTLKEFLKVIGKTEEVNDNELSLYKNPSFFVLLLSCFGDKYRSIDGISGLGFKTLTKIINEGISSRQITDETLSIDLLSQIFSNNSQEEIIENFHSLQLKNSYSLLLDGDKKSILSQMIDRSDINDLLELNKKMFHNNELRLDSLSK